MGKVFHDPAHCVIEGLGKIGIGQIARQAPQVRERPLEGIEHRVCPGMRSRRSINATGLGDEVFRFAQQALMPLEPVDKILHFNPCFALAEAATAFFGQFFRQSFKVTQEFEGILCRSF